MSEAVWKNCKFYAGGYDFSGWLNALGIDYSSDTPDATTMGALAKRRLPGLVDLGFSLNGQVDYINPDKYMYDQIGLSEIPITMSQTGADGTISYLYKPLVAQYTPGASIGEVMAFSVKGEGTSRLVRGLMLYPKTTKTSSSTGTITLIKAVAAGEKLYAILHVFSASAGDTLDVIVQSDELVGFGSPATVITFTADGPITDTYYRVSFTIGGVDPSFSFAVSLGIL